MVIEIFLIAIVYFAGILTHKRFSINYKKRWQEAVRLLQGGESTKQLKSGPRKPPPPPPKTRTWTVVVHPSPGQQFMYVYMQNRHTKDRIKLYEVGTRPSRTFAERLRNAKQYAEKSALEMDA